MQKWIMVKLVMKDDAHTSTGTKQQTTKVNTIKVEDELPCKYW